MNVLIPFCNIFKYFLLILGRIVVLFIKKFKAEAITDEPYKYMANIEFPLG